MSILTEKHTSPEKTAAFSREHGVIVSNRPYLEVLTDVLGLEESQVKQRDVLSLGEGLSDFVLHLNNDGIARAKAIDPAYALVQNSSSLADFSKKAYRSGLTVVPDANRYKQIKKAIKADTHLPFASHDELPFANESFDIIVASMIAAPFNGDRFVSDFYGRFGEIGRVLRSDGYFCAGTHTYRPETYPKTREAFRHLQNQGWQALLKSNNTRSWLYFTRAPQENIRSMQEATPITF